jgi:Zn finger protein HypA/HybF involved in hydrogenase expression
MAAAATITCPKCKKTFKGRLELEGKRVRCPRCDNAFRVRMDDTLKVDRGGAVEEAIKPAAPTKDRPAPSTPPVPSTSPAPASTPLPPIPPWDDAPLPMEPPPPGAAAAATAAPPPPKPVVDEDDEFSADANPYGVTTLDLRARCPNCANPMESEDAVVCLFCGYNTQTRTLGSTKKTVETTHADVFAWLMPGFICLGSIVLIVLFCLFYCVMLPDLVGDAFYVRESVRWWIVVICLGGMWPLGRYAMNRLVLDPVPPELEKD